MKLKFWEKESKKSSYSLPQLDLIESIEESRKEVKKMYKEAIQLDKEPDTDHLISYNVTIRELSKKNLLIKQGWILRFS